MHNEKQPSESIIVDGITFRRYPDSECSSTRNYFRSSGWSTEGPVYLHRYLWERAHGPVPEGCHVHHKDGDPSNNSLENLEVVTPGEHWGKHDEARKRWWASPEFAQHIRQAGELAAEWHRSESGKDWHRKHAQAVFGKEGRTRVPVTCLECGQGYLADSMRVKAGKAKFCGNNCKARAFRKANPGYDRRFRKGVRPDGAGGS